MSAQKGPDIWCSRVERGGWRVKGGGWRVEGGGWRGGVDSRELRADGWGCRVQGSGSRVQHAGIPSHTRKPPISSHNLFHQSVLESQLPHKIENLLFTISDWGNKMTVLWGSWLPKTFHKYIVPDKIRTFVAPRDDFLDRPHISVPGNFHLDSLSHEADEVRGRTFSQVRFA